MAICKSEPPYQVNLKAGEGARICRCGNTGCAPFCDGSHDSCGLHQAYVLSPAGFEQHVWVCSCGQSQSMPYCDGSKH